MVQQFIKELLRGMFFSKNSVFTWPGFLPFVCFFWPWLERKMKERIKKARRYALTILPWFFLVSAIFTSYSMYENKQKQIDALQNQIRVIKQVDNPKAKAAAIRHIKRPRSRPRLRLQEPTNISRPSLKGIIDPNK